MKDLVISNSVTSINQFQFYGFSSITSIKLPNQLKEIKDNAFNYCSSLTEIYIPISVEVVGQYVFYGCKNLTINCAASSKPAKWSYIWNCNDSASNTRPVNWGV